MEDHRPGRNQRRTGLADRRHRLSLGRVGQVEHRRAGRQEWRRDAPEAVADRRPGERLRRWLPVLRRPGTPALQGRGQRRGAGAPRAVPRDHRRRRQDHSRGHRLRPADGQLQRRPRPRRRQRGVFLRRRGDSLHPGLAGTHHRRTGGPCDPGRPRVRRQRAQDPRQGHGDHRRGDEPLVPHGHELPRSHQHADDVRLHRPERRRLGTLRRPGKAPPADWLGAPGLRHRLEPAATADERHQLLLYAQFAVAAREAVDARGAIATG
ncbi:hypothetical protein D9M71_423320 [compost metagenome]